MFKKYFIIFCQNLILFGSFFANVFTILLDLAPLKWKLEDLNSKKAQVMPFILGTSCFCRSFLLYMHRKNKSIAV